MKKWAIALMWVCSGCASSVVGQVTFPQLPVRHHPHHYYALQGATIIRQAGDTVKDGTLIVRDGKILYAGKRTVTPAGAVEVPCEELYIYPSFIDLYSDYGLKKSRGDERKEEGGPISWNPALHPRYDAYRHLRVDSARLARYHRAGFGLVLTHRQDGISRGSGALVFLLNDKPHLTLLKSQAAHHLSFKKGSSKHPYPGSLMGVIALLRQTLYDAQWYKRYGHQEEVNADLEALNQLLSLPQIFETSEWLDIFRAHRIGEEFGIDFIYKGSGTEYRRAADIAKIADKIILPLQYPLPYDVTDPLKSRYIRYEKLKHWEWAPFNAAYLTQHGIEVALTMQGLKGAGDFFDAVRKTIESQWSEEEALRALTLTPARWLGIDDVVGTLERGKWANFLVTDGPLFHERTTILQNWVKGRPHLLSPLYPVDIRSTYDFILDTLQGKLNIRSTSRGKLQLFLSHDTFSTMVSVQYRYPSIGLGFVGPDSLLWQLEGTVSRDSLFGSAYVAGEKVMWKAQRIHQLKKTKPFKSRPYPPAFRFPFVAYGWKQLPTADDYLIRNATVWTNEEEGVLPETDVLVIDGVIRKVGKDLPLPPKGVVEIDATGLHLTSGIIDEHSHIAIRRGVNECTHNVTAEVRVGDVINSEDVHIYRQLAGGVTAAQLLHGSCNPIGGQSAIIKFRWGRLPEELKIRDADPFIKFALGENVKRSRVAHNKRFPNTRMGVEQTIEDAFNAALQYERDRQRNPDTTRKNLQLDALVEILHSKRFVTCHSYVQSEITMLMRLAERLGFRINTFTHGLEAYKVADKIKAHGAGVSSFSDWWAYKYEVKDAIPYNPAICTKMGVITAVNSDDAEMGRRLNQEAAKSIKYGGLSEEEAWKLVTLNPAKLLHLDHRTGSIRPGKDADLVLWSANPLSIHAKALKTWVDGILYYDAERDKELQQQLQRERQRIIDNMLREKLRTGKSQPPDTKPARKPYHCDDAEDEGNGEALP